MITPLRNKVILVQKIAEERTAFGIYIPNEAQEKLQEGKIVAIGADVKNIKVNDYVMYEKYSGTHFKKEGKEYIIMDDTSIIAKMEEEDE